MKLNKLVNKISSFTRIDILDVDGSRIFPVDKVSEFKTEDLRKYKVKQISAFTQEPGIVTIYVKECKNANN